MKLVIENTLKIADFNEKQFYPEFIKFLTEETEPIYRDTVLKEHIYNIENILEESENHIDLLFISQLEDIQEVLNANDCSYFRITFN